MQHDDVKHGVQLFKTCYKKISVRQIFLREGVQRPQQRKRRFSLPWRRPWSALYGMLRSILPLKPQEQLFYLNKKLRPPLSVHNLIYSALQSALLNLFPTCTMLARCVNSLHMIRNIWIGLINCHCPCSDMLYNTNNVIQFTIMLQAFNSILMF